MAGGLQMIKSGCGRPVRGTCLEVLNKGAERGMGCEGKITRQSATLNGRKSYSIIADKRF
jgi:hypothetical protein